MPCPDEWCGWHSGDGLGNGNTATIAIEIIGDSKKAEENGAKLAAYLLDKYDLLDKYGFKSPYLHQDSTRK